MRLPACLLLLSLAGCATPAPEPPYLGFAPSCATDAGSWETCRRKNNRDDRQTVAAFQKMLDDTFAQVLAESPLSGKFTVSQFDLVVVRSAAQSFLFESNAGTRNGTPVYTVRTSSETFATITKIAIARHLYKLPRFGEEWLSYYLLYLRRTPEGQELMDPLRASGMLPPKGLALAPGVPDFSYALRQGINDTYYLTSFMVAHELYHIENPATCSDDSPSCRARRRADEAAADVYATAIMERIGRKDGTEGYQLAIPSYLFSQLMLVMEGVQGRSPVDPAFHPPTHERLRFAAIALKSWVDANPSSPASTDLRTTAEYALRIASRIDSETPDAYFAGLDQESVGVTLKSLKLY